LIGGEDTDGPFDHENRNLTEQKVKLLEHRFSTMFPGVAFKPAYIWAGTFAETKDGLPYIGRLPGRRHVYCALGYGGNGITFSMIAARLLTDLILQRPNEDAPVFRFER
jgi:glycine/D-amino acid oxidase-like deaminating enzyme